MSNKSTPDDSGDAQHERKATLAEDVDTIMDQIDDVLTEDAYDFVRKYVQKGGQGWTSFLDPSFFIGAAAAGVAASASWDTFKATMTRVIKAIRKARTTKDGFEYPDELFNRDGSLSELAEHQIRYSWSRANTILTNQPPGHDIDEAQALHWITFLSELQKATGMVKLRPEHYKKISAAAAASPENLHPSQLVARIIDDWLGQHPNAEIGLNRD